MGRIKFDLAAVQDLSLHDCHDFMAWTEPALIPGMSSPVPYLVRYEPAGNVATVTFKVADDDYKNVWAQEPETLTVSVSDLERSGGYPALLNWADCMVSAELGFYRAEQAFAHQQEAAKTMVAA
ncbi:MAG: hypothetical protein HQL38_01580 [Alphaproteobacteria bacterium]|nr:hypothetical protein [Alphaproteobacteria bacterium]